MINIETLKAEKSELESKLKVIEEERLKTVRKLALVRELLKILILFEPEDQFKKFDAQFK